MTSVLIGASSVAQLEENLAAAGHSDFTDAELAEIDHDAVEARHQPLGGVRHGLKVRCTTFWVPMINRARRAG